MRAEFECRPFEEIEIPYEQFDSWPHRLGWKHEYWDGKLRLSPAHSALVDCERSTDFVSSSTWKPTLIDDADREELHYLFRWSFHDSIHYVGYTSKLFSAEADREMDRIFQSETTLRSCCFRVRDNNRIVGAIVVRSTEDGPKIGPLMVAPTHQRQGVATELLACACESIRSRGEKVIYSGYHLGNKRSTKWHAQSGFVEIPNWQAASHRHRHYLQRSSHHQAKNEQSLAITMRSLADQYKRLADQLREASFRKMPAN